MFNRICSLIIFLCCLPILLFLSFFIFFTTYDNPIFIQKRIGHKGKPFNIFKLRTMKNEVVTPIGATLRKYRLDELPQFLNIAIGDMNVCGPRPLLKEDYDIYNFDMDIRTKVKPGITGWAQINGPLKNISDKMIYDTYYIENKSLKLDCYIIYISAKTLFTGKRLNDK